MNWLCAFEAMNLDTLFSDCHDLSTTRGGGLAVLKIGEEVAEQLGVDAISASASQGLMEIPGDSAKEVETKVRDLLIQLPLMEYVTFGVAACPAGVPGDGKFQERLAGLKNRLRWEQLQLPSVVYPSLHGPRVCEIDGVRPASKEETILFEKDKSRLSAFTHARWELGRRQKHALLELIVGSGVRAVLDLNELADPNGLAIGNAAGKLAVLRFDGNDFGKRVAECKEPKDLQAFSKQRVAEQTEFIQSLLEPMNGWITAKGTIRLEILVYGGDEVTIVVPAWLGWLALRRFYSMKFQQGITYSGGLVFCHSNAPIHTIKRLASELTDKAKDYAKASQARGNAKGNFVVHQPLESFDSIGRELDEWMGERYRACAGGTDGAILGIQEIEILATNMSYWKAAISKRKLYDLVARIRGGAFQEWGDTELKAELLLLLDAKGSGSEKILSEIQKLNSTLGRSLFQHVLELWDYVGIDAVETGQ